MYPYELMKHSKVLTKIFFSYGVLLYLHAIEQFIKTCRYSFFSNYNDAMVLFKDFCYS